MITVSNVARAVPRPITGQPGQAYFGVVLIGLLAGVALVFWTDPLLTRWQYRRPPGHLRGGPGCLSRKISGEVEVQAEGCL